MAGKLSIYFDTSVFSAYYDERNVDRMITTQDFWDTISDLNLYASDLTLDELSAHPDFQIRELLLQLTSNFDILDSKVAEDLADEYMKHEVFPKGKEDDALHVAIASFYGINILVSWNFKHIVKRKTRNTISMINTLFEYPIPEIISPLEF
jgi:predicted nucleic acid-binding protein